MRRLETEQRLIHLHGMTVQNQTVSKGRDKAQDKNTEKANRYYVFPSSTNDLSSYHSIFVNYFHTVQNQYMVFWL